MNELGFKIFEQQGDMISCKVIATKTYGISIGILLKQQAEAVTGIRIRVGTYSDEALSELIYDNIKKNM